jgi:hypothetical protein
VILNTFAFKYIFIEIAAIKAASAARIEVHTAIVDPLFVSGALMSSAIERKQLELKVF